MPRITGDTSVSINFEVKKTTPLDTRQWVEYLSDLTGTTTFSSTYTGMTVSVYADTISNNGVYYYNGKGITNINNWIKLLDSNSNVLTSFTGGTVTGTTNFTNGLSANTISATTIYLSGNSITDVLSNLNNPNNLTGATFNPNNYKVTLFNSTGGTNPSNYELDLSVLATDMTVTGGTYDPNNGTVTFTNNSGGTFSVSGFTVGYTDLYVTGGTFNNNSLNLVKSDGSNVSSITGLSENIKYLPTTLSSGLTSNGIGGISGGTKVSDLSGKTIINILSDLIFPTVNPTFGANPSYSLSYSNISSLVEITSGVTTFTPSITGTFNRSTYTLNGVSYPWAGLPTAYTFSGQNIITPITGYSNATTYTYTYPANSLTATTGYMYFNSTVYYGVGSQPYDNKGNPYGNPYPSGSISYTLNSLKVEGVYPIYATVSSITTKDKQTLYSMLTANNIQITLAAETGGNKQTFWIPTGWTRPLTSINYFSTITNSFDSTNKITDFTQTTDTINGISYKQYTNNAPNRGSTQIKLIF